MGRRKLEIQRARQQTLHKLQPAKEAKVFPKTSSNPHEQTGEALLDALLAMVLVAILGLASVYASAKAAVVQQTAISQQFVSAQLRQQLPQIIRNCPSTEATPVALPDGSSLDVEVSCVEQASMTSANGSAVTLSGASRWNVSLEVELNGAQFIVTSIYSGS